jgi:hypothetical protein
LGCPVWRAIANDSVIGFPIAIIVRSIAYFIAAASHIGIALGFLPTGGANPGAESFAFAQAQGASLAQGQKRFIGFPIAVVIQIIAKLF